MEKDGEANTKDAGEDEDEDEDDQASEKSKKKNLRPGWSPLSKVISRGLVLPYLLRKNAGAYSLPGDEVPSTWALLTIEIHLREDQKSFGSEDGEGDKDEDKVKTADSEETLPDHHRLHLSVDARLHLSGLATEHSIAAAALSCDAQDPKIDYS